MDVETIASAIRARGLEMPAILFLEMHKPLISLGRALAPLCAPVLGLALGSERVSQITSLLDSPRAVELLIAKLEEPHGH